MNESMVDRMARVLVGIVLLLLAFLVLHGAWQIVLWVVGGILLITGVTGFCLIYRVFNFSTKK